MKQIMLLEDCVAQKYICYVKSMIYLQDGTYQNQIQGWYHSGTVPGGTVVVPLWRKSGAGGVVLFSGSRISNEHKKM